MRAGRASKPATQLIKTSSGDQTVEVEEVVLGTPKAADEQDTWVPICRPEDLPKGVRKEADVDGVQVLLFWYRNQIYAIESRSPAEGAYSEGFIKAKFTQDYCIECPSTGSLFSLKDGSIVSWYPNNAVLRALTPESTCRPLEIYPVKLTQEAIYVNVNGGYLGGLQQRGDRGGAGTSLENNNVFTVQPTIYFEGQDPTVERASYYLEPVGNKPNPLVAISTTVGVGLLAVAGTAVGIYYENVAGVVLLWVALGGIAVFVGLRYVESKVKETSQ